uniref:ATP synthase F0 subunit 8 n=1 Tax=Tremoctopus violaceus TaxID=102883 RepID=A0A3S6PTU4_9MOLL|nr:ATP synthase F0 subunit 8 [Tremoctopus violaceus]ATR85788.1 ATP synthase F0 subunit 8 [Tremoctopus violaceus]WBK26781.1 ATP synthase F0 subunit 8 [Tremoctopus violaceus]
MPQLSPLNWFFLFFLFWMLMSLNSSIMWWNNKNMYSTCKFMKNKKNMKYNW